MLYRFVRRADITMRISKLTIMGLVLVLFSLLTRLAQTLYMPGIIERTRVGPADPMLVPLGLAIFAGYLLLPIGIGLCIVGFFAHNKNNKSGK